MAHKLLKKIAIVIIQISFCAEINWNSWLEPFQYELWFFILGFINVILVVIWWIDRKSPFGHFRELDSGDDGFTLLGICVFKLSQK